MGASLKGRSAIVTGGGRGIGRAIALALAGEGASVLVCDLGAASDGTGRDAAPADSVVQECRSMGARAMPHYGDVADFAAAEDMVKTCSDNFGGVDIVCNMAGNFTLSRVFEMSESEWDSVIDVHLKGTFNLTRHAGPLMVRQRYGRIINCSSFEYIGTIPIVGHANYLAAKGGIVSLTYATAREMEPYGTTCNCITPRAASRMADEWSKRGLELDFVPKELTEDQEMMEDHGDPETFSPLIAFLAGERAGHINGQVFFCSPGTLGIWSRAQVARQVSRDWKKEGGWSIDEVENVLNRELLPE